MGWIRSFGMWIALLSILALPTSSQAGFELSTGLGGHFGGEVDTDIGTFDTDGGYLQKISLDFFPTRYLGLGLYNAFGTTALGGVDDTILVEVGLAIKPRLTAEDLLGDVDLLVTPDIMIGYRGLFPDTLDSSSGLALNFGLDLRARWDNGFSAFIEPGFFAQPVGGNSDTDVTFSPIGFVLLGVGYAY